MLSTWTVATNRGWFLIQKGSCLHSHIIPSSCGHCIQTKQFLRWLFRIEDSSIRWAALKHPATSHKWEQCPSTRTLLCAMNAMLCIVIGFRPNKAGWQYPLGLGVKVSTVSTHLHDKMSAKSSSPSDFVLPHGSTQDTSPYLVQARWQITRYLLQH